MYWFGAFIIFILLITGCASGTRQEADASSLLNANLLDEQAALNTFDENQLAFNIDNISINLLRPVGWEYYETEYGIALAEQMGSVATDGQLGGLLMHIFVPPLDDLNMNIAGTDNLAWQTMRQIIGNPNYIGKAAVSPPYAFSWDGHDAAYYLMNNGRKNHTIVIGIVAPSTSRLVIVSISAPAAQADRIREALPTLLSDLTVNQVVIESMNLDNLPMRLDFPIYLDVALPLMIS